MEGASGFRDERAPEHDAAQTRRHGRDGAGDHIASPAVPDERNAVRTEVVDIRHQGVDAFVQGQPGRVVIDAEARASHGEGPVPSRAKGRGDALVRPAAVPGAGDKHEILTHEGTLPSGTEAPLRSITSRPSRNRRFMKTRK